MGRRYLVVDTESSLCLQRRQRILVSLAYEIVDLHGTVHASYYAIVRLPPWSLLDEESTAVHGITPELPRRIVPEGEKTIPGLHRNGTVSPWRTSCGSSWAASGSTNRWPS